MVDERVGGLRVGGLQPLPVAELVDEVAARLRQAATPQTADPRTGAREIVAAVLDVPRYWPMMHPSYEVAPETWKHALAAADKCARGAPLAYAVGRANFRRLTLEVDERVLIPRPETELLVDLVLRRRNTGTAMDVGTGSGAIAIALAKEGSFERIVATDISLDAIDVARRNASVNGVSIEFEVANQRPATGDRRGAFDVIVSNPPYISYDEIRELPDSVRNWEPAVALLCGENGMAATAQIVKDAGTRLKRDGLLALEVDSRRASLGAELVASDGRYENVSVELDLAGRERFVLATRREHP